MLIEEIIDIDERQIWARNGTQIVRRYRCTSGPRRGRTVTRMDHCYAAPDLKKQSLLKLTRARLGTPIKKKAKKTKRINPASRKLSVLNKRRK